MGLHVTTDPAEIAGLLTAAVALDPVANTVLATIAASLDRPDAAPWAARPDDAPTELAVRSQSHTAVALTAGWRDVASLAAALAALDPPVQAIAGRPDLVAGLAASLGRVPTARTDERLFRLDALIEPAPTAGEARPARDADVDLLTRWYADFGLAAFGRVPPGFGAREQVVRDVATSTCWLWTVDGVPVSMAARRPSAAGVARIGPVYTPAAFRGHGYASAATAAAVREILAAGHTPCLYTDLANPTSNKIYQALGFRAVLDRCSVRFD